jgi:dipeptidase D
VNAIKALARVLSAAFDVAPFELSALDGGVSRNAIPRDAAATVAVPPDAEQAFRAAAEAELAAIARQYADTDDGLALKIAPATATELAGAETTRRVLDLMAAIPSGVLAMSPALTGVVETSTSLTTTTTKDGSLTLGSMTRSSNAAALDEALATMCALARLAEAGIEVRRSYPPWEPRLASPLLATATSTFALLFGFEPGLAVVHGGLECAVLGQKLAGVEMISIGPKMVGLHAPGEKVRISSTQRFYRLLGALLDDLSS